MLFSSCFHYFSILSGNYLTYPQFWIHRDGSYKHVQVYKHASENSKKFCKLVFHASNIHRQRFCRKSNNLWAFSPITCSLAFLSCSIDEMSHKQGFSWVITMNWTVIERWYVDDDILFSWCKNCVKPTPSLISLCQATLIQQTRDFHHENVIEEVGEDVLFLSNRLPHVCQRLLQRSQTKTRFANYAVFAKFLSG